MLEIPQKLPSELISHILDWAAKRYRNGTTLRACALVSREWSPYAQRQLFRHITISTSRRSTEEWIQRLKTHSHLATFITNLTLCERTEEEAEAWTAELAEELGRILSRVRSFTLRSFYSTSLEEAEIERCHYRFFEHLGGAEGVHTLHVGWVRFETAKLMFQYLSKIPGNIIKLSLQEVGADSFLSSDFEDAGPITPNSFQGASRWALRSLTLASSQLREDVLSWLLGSVDLSGLQHLVLDCDEIRYDLVGDVVSGLLEKLMVTIGPSLRHLVLGVAPGEEDINDAHIGES
ncbi:hypothetical protein MPER_04048 [Moniliophthora perniciosa FA553]|nr:hypothetical protein MPER_04048 [Moniliophthora perniciosa FA553]